MTAREICALMQVSSKYFWVSFLKKFTDLLLFHFEAVNCSTRAFLSGRQELWGHLISKRKN